MNTKPVVIQKTTKYDLFKGVLGNRDVSQNHVAELSASVGRKNMLAYAPIIINEKYEIIDGQHRLQVAKNNNLDIYYVVMDGAGIEEIQMMNATNRRWQASDFLESYRALGRPKYMEFADFIRNHNLSIRQGLSFLLGVEGGTQFLAFKRGLLDFTKEDMVKAELKAGLREELVPYFIDTGYNRSAFFQAVSRIVDKKLERELVNKTRVAHIPLRSQITVKDYMRMFEDVLNWRRQKDVILLGR